MEDQKPHIICSQELKARLDAEKNKSTTYEDLIWGLYWTKKCLAHWNNNNKIEIIWSPNKNTLPITRRGYIHSLDDRGGMVFFQNPDSTSVYLELSGIRNITNISHLALETGEDVLISTSPDSPEVEDGS
ncbi:MAG: hypothetical protein ABII03_00780 [Nanoarchaeota archaeon]